jgi:crossover junction endodeoxyribonuclease RusA
MNQVSFTIQGIAVPQGSMFAFTPRGWKRPIITSANSKLKKWRETVRATAIKEMGFAMPAGRHVPLRVDLVFFLEKAKSNKLYDAVKKPDLDKLVRGLLDGMTKVVYDDDSQIVELHASKSYGQPRVEVRVEEVGLVSALFSPAEIKDSEIPF